MKIEHFNPEGRPSLSKLVEQVETSTDDALESTAAGFAFPVHEKVRKMNDIQIPSGVEGTKTVSKSDLLRVTLQGVKDSWEKAIEQRIGAIRNSGIEESERKDGSDFFTEADTESEKLIVDEFKKSFGENTLQFFGEEAGDYTGNPESNITIRIDPIDGTKTFKFGKQDWCTMVGAYEGARDAQEQVVAVIFAPERSELLYYVKDVGTFMHNLDSGETGELLAVQDQNDMRDLIVSFYSHTVLEERGNEEGIMKALDKEGATVKMFSSGTEVMEALLTRGKRILIFDGDMDQTDYIPYPMLVHAGYKIYKWGSDEEIRPEDPELANKKVVIVPPGLAGEKVRELIKQAHV